MTIHRFRPRYRGIAWSSMGIGTFLTYWGIAGPVIISLATGVIGVVLGATYLASPSWRLEVVTDDAGFEVRSRTRSRFKLAWSEVVRVVAAPATNTCFVDGGSPETSLLVPGVGAPAPYDIEDRPTLVATILAHVHPDRIERVESLERAAAASTPA